MSDGLLARLELLVERLVRWNRAINLVAPGTLPDAWQRHVADSVQLVPLVADPPGLWVDLGSGAGFPGLVVAAVLADRSARTRVHLIEADRRKAAFLHDSARAMALDVTVHGQRIESLAPLGAGIVSARAVAPLDRLLPLAVRHLAPDGACLFLKGARVEDELASVAGSWSFNLSRHPSQSGATGEILHLRDVSHV